ncbi:hypothetical protein niasHT_027334 [Heterodera trifolii]|uniref:Uncharacterized protein n=1 Tax=Heterodera trifolii TaxID=157864 RepID=A0ABD2JTQ8_9BILA
MHRPPASSRRGSASLWAKRAFQVTLRAGHFRGRSRAVCAHRSGQSRPVEDPTARLPTVRSCWRTTNSRPPHEGGASRATQHPAGVAPAESRRPCHAESDSTRAARQ